MHIPFAIARAATAWMMAESANAEIAIPEFVNRLANACSQVAITQIAQQVSAPLSNEVDRAASRRAPSVMAIWSEAVASIA